jgi:hypothetical protein
MQPSLIYSINRPASMAKNMLSHNLLTKPWVMDLFRQFYVQNMRYSVWVMCSSKSSINMCRNEVLRLYPVSFAAAHQRSDTTLTCDRVLL